MAEELVIPSSKEMRSYIQKFRMFMDVPLVGFGEPDFSQHFDGVLRMLNRVQFMLDDVTDGYNKLPQMTLGELAATNSIVATLSDLWDQIDELDRRLRLFPAPPQLDLSPFAEALAKEYLHPKRHREFIEHLAKAAGVMDSYEELMRDTCLVVLFEPLKPTYAMENLLKVIPSKPVFKVPRKLLDVCALEPAQSVLPVGGTPDSVVETAVTLYGGADFKTLSESLESARVI